MKRNFKKILLLFLTIISLNVYCQDSAIVVCMHLSYSNPEARVLYNYNFYNKFLILSLYDFEFYATCKGAELTEIEEEYPVSIYAWGYFNENYKEGYYYYKNYSMSNIKSDTVSIFVYNREDSTLVKQFDYEYKKTNYYPLKIQLGYLKDSLVTVNDVLMQNDLIAFFENSYIPHCGCRLTYQIKIISNNNETFYAREFDDHTKGIIKDLKPGSKIIFYNVNTLTPSGPDIRWSNIEYTIIE